MNKADRATVARLLNVLATDTDAKNNIETINAQYLVEDLVSRLATIASLIDPDQTEHGLMRATPAYKVIDDLEVSAELSMMEIMEGGPWSSYFLASGDPIPGDED